MGQFYQVNFEVDLKITVIKWNIRQYYCVDNQEAVALQTVLLTLPITDLPRFGSQPRFSPSLVSLKCSSYGEMRAQTKRKLLTILPHSFLTIALRITTGTKLGASLPLRKSFAIPQQLVGFSHKFADARRKMKSNIRLGILSESFSSRILKCTVIIVKNW